MNPEVGRFVDGLNGEDRRLALRLKDLWEGLGSDVGTQASTDRLDAHRAGRLFLRLRPSDPGFRLSFPQGGSLYDPHGRLKDWGGSQRFVHLRDSMDLDAPVRKLMEDAYRLVGA